jgi:hypothetical protein
MSRCSPWGEAKRKAVRLDARVRQPDGFTTRSLRVLQESQIEGRKHQNNADIHHQPFPESILEEQQIHTNDNGYHRHTV